MSWGFVANSVALQNLALLAIFNLSEDEAAYNNVSILHRDDVPYSCEKASSGEMRHGRWNVYPSWKDVCVSGAIDSIMISSKWLGLFILSS